MSQKFRLNRKIDFQNMHYTKCINIIIDCTGPSIILRSIYVLKIMRNNASFREKKSNKQNFTSLTYLRPLVKSAYQKNNFLISHPKYMLWVLKRTLSNETVLLSTQNIC